MAGESSTIWGAVIFRLRERMAVIVDWGIPTALASEPWLSRFAAINSRRMSSAGASGNRSC